MKEFPQFDIASALRKVHMHVCVEREREGGREREGEPHAAVPYLRVPVRHVLQLLLGRVRVDHLHLPLHLLLLKGAGDRWTVS